MIIIYCYWFLQIRCTFMGNRRMEWDDSGNHRSCMFVQQEVRSIPPLFPTIFTEQIFMRKCGNCAPPGKLSLLFFHCTVSNNRDRLQIASGPNFRGRERASLFPLSIFLIQLKKWILIQNTIQKCDMHSLLSRLGNWPFSHLEHCTLPK